MSNIKEVDIAGWMPFNIYENEVAAKWLGYLNAPSIGIRISYGYTKMGEVNKWGGRTTYYEFGVKGREAMSYQGLDKMVKDFEAAGCEVSSFQVRDAEENTSWESGRIGDAT